MNGIPSRVWRLAGVGLIVAGAVYVFYLIWPVLLLALWLIPVPSLGTVALLWLLLGSEEENESSRPKDVAIKKVVGGGYEVMTQTGDQTWTNGYQHFEGPKYGDVKKIY